MLTINKSRSGPHNFIFILFFLFTLISSRVISAEEASAELAQTYRNQGYALQQKGDLNGALMFYTKAIALGGVTNPVLLNDIGIIYEQLGMEGKAARHYLKALSENDQYLPAYSNLAYLYLNQGKDDLAFPYLRKRYELSDLNDPWAAKAKEEMLRIRPEYASWIVQKEAEKLNQELQNQRHEELVDQVTRANQYVQRGREYFSREEYEKALVELNRALHLTPDNPKIQNARQEVIRALTSKQIRERSELAIQKMSAGDSYSAKREIQQILSTIPNEPVFNSR